ncbi:DUF952 domain-containing protein [Mycolicibacterium sp. S2-37]|uniref:DUF952 domain-containing protein n=1 Tax=Mycolicibacterium sp. S2-37 TaxID=2810297 RepID=UPI001A9441E4|nr:DUF952 domain-containing protein [Mycolicibacterium sp. S2-37]MBO0676984.1 DUF952 domain-containing protein [Mycolicibacterium sp. S2-37]
MYPDSTVKSPLFVHVCGAAEWARSSALGEHRPESLSQVGFVHLSTPEQVHLPANRLYRGRTDLLLLHVDPRRLSDPVRWEPGVPDDPASMRFPHLYGPLPTAAVIEVTPYRPEPDGSFTPLDPSPT